MRVEIDEIRFQNYKLLRDTTLPLTPLTLLVGANGSGKSSVFDALRSVAANRTDLLQQARTFGVPHRLPLTSEDAVRVTVAGRTGDESVSYEWTGTDQAGPEGAFSLLRQNQPGVRGLLRTVEGFRVYALSHERLEVPSALVPGTYLEPDGGNLAGALDQFRDREPERWSEMNEALPAWLPEFDQVLFETPKPGHRAVVLRTKRGKHRVPAHVLSSGSRLVLGLLAITYGAANTTFFGIEEPETGIHPRLLRNVYDALVRITDPAEATGELGTRQVIVTTHSPYLLDLFRDSPESVVVAERHYGGDPVDDVTFSRLSDRRDIDDVISAGPLGDAWYTGVLGGVPVPPKRGRITPGAGAAA